MHATSTQPPPTRPARTFWWDRARPLVADVSPLDAVIFDVDALGDDADGAARAALIDLVMSLFVAGISIGVVSPGRRERAVALARDRIGDGLVETIVSADDVMRPGDAELYRLALCELGSTADSALAIAGSPRSCRAALAVGLPVVVNTGGCDPAEGDCRGVVAALTGYDGLLAADCRRLQARWWVTRAAFR